MLDASGCDLKKIAGDQLTSSSLLTELSNNSDSEIRLLVASNPNTPVDILMKLGEEFPDTIPENPVFDLIRLEEPDSRFVRLSLARSIKTAPEILAKLAATEKEDETICCAVARNINTPIDALKRLVGWRATSDRSLYPSIHVAKEAINNPNMTLAVLEELLDRFINEGWIKLFREFCKLPELSMNMIERLSKQDGVNYLLIDLPLIQQLPDILDNIARNSMSADVCIKILKNSVTLDSTIEYLAAHQDLVVRNAVIDRPNVSQKALDIISFIQGKPGIPIDLLNELAEDSRLHVLKLVTKYPGTPEKIAEKALNSKYYIEPF